MKRVHLYLPEQTISFFKRFAKVKGIKEAELYRRALDDWREEFLAKHAPKIHS